MIRYCIVEDSTQIMSPLLQFTVYRLSGYTELVAIIGENVNFGRIFRKSAPQNWKLENRRKFGGQWLENSHAEATTNDDGILRTGSWKEHLERNVCEESKAPDWNIKRKCSKMTEDRLDWAAFQGSLHMRK